jgi:hypothetical protein
MAATISLYELGRRIGPEDPIRMASHA